MREDMFLMREDTIYKHGQLNLMKRYMNQDEPGIDFDLLLTTLCDLHTCVARP